MSALADIVDLLAALDRSWWKDATCHAWLADNPGRPTPWHVASNDDPVDGVPAHKLVDYALLCCAACKAQYRCATFGISDDVSAGTYAMRIRQLRWLRKQPDWRDIIMEAEVTDTPVQVVVKAMRKHRGG